MAARLALVLDADACLDHNLPIVQSIIADYDDEFVTGLVLKFLEQAPNWSWHSSKAFCHPSKFFPAPNSQSSTCAWHDHAIGPIVRAVVCARRAQPTLSSKNKIQVQVKLFASSVQRDAAASTLDVGG